MILLADTAIAEGELDAQRLDEEIADAEEDLADAPDEEKRLWQEKLDRLRELKDAMKL
jgi:F-type H+-transporting ATPase subunit epsilon